MIIQSIHLKNFRNYSQLDLHPDVGVNIFFGPNGSGKTNILEAIHYCALGKSHRVSNDQSVIKNGETDAVCELSIRNQISVQTVGVHISKSESNRKSIFINSKKIQRFSDMMGCFRCVIFSPEDLDMIKEGPSVRRKYLDMMISQIDSKYFIALQRYRIALEQRNALLKRIRAGEADLKVLVSFDEILAEEGRTIIQKRTEIVHKLTEVAMDVYHNISGQEDELLQIQYQSVLPDSESIPDGMMKGLYANREDDIRTGLTSIGPHRDDLIFSLNRKNMKMYSSQGQIRTAALSLKLTQIRILYEYSGDRPVLLLDDVMSELDRNRRVRLENEISQCQTFITCTDESDLEMNQSRNVFSVYSIGNDGFAVSSSGSDSVQHSQMREPDFS